MPTNPNVLITGSSTGIGQATALHLDRLGFRVFAGVRKMEDGNALCAQASGRLTPLLLDVTDSQAIAHAKEVVAATVGPAGLAGLVNNAGVGFDSPVEFIPLDDLRALFEVNVFGVIAVTQAFLPLVRQARGRIVNISSSLQIVVAPFSGSYSASKFAVGGFSRALRMEVRPFGVKVSVVVPGIIDTPIWKKGKEWTAEVRRAQASRLDPLYGKAFGKMQQYSAGLGQKGIPPEEVARAIAHALTATHAKHYYLVGREARLFSLLTTFIPERFHDWIALRTIGIEG